MKPTGPIPKRVKCIKAVTDSYTVGKLYDVNDKGFVIDNYRKLITKWDQGGKDNSHFNPIYTDEELLEYAKKMYPEGTYFYNSKGECRKSEGVNYLTNKSGFISVQAFDQEDYRLAPNIYSPATGWAEIIGPSEDSVKQTYMFKEGDPVISKVHPGVTGFTVCGFEDKKSMYLICSPTWNLGHNGAHVIPVWGKVPDTSDNSCWWVHEEDLVLDNQTKGKDIDTFIINVGDYVKIIDRPAHGIAPSGWNVFGEMDYLYGTWQEVCRIRNPNKIEIYAPDRPDKDTWTMDISDITEVRSYNPDMYISGCDIAIKGGDVTVRDTVDIGPSKSFVDHLAGSVRLSDLKSLSEMQTQYNIHQHGIQQLIRDSEDYLMWGNKAKEGMLPVPSLRVSRKNIKK